MHMPYKVEKSGKGWFVVNKDTGKRKNKAPHASKSKAQAHMRALYAATANESYDDVIANYLLEYASTTNTNNPLGATATNKFQPGTAGAPQPQQPSVNLNDPKHQELAYEMMKGPNDPAWSQLPPQRKKQLIDDFKKRMQQSTQADAMKATNTPNSNTPVNPSGVGMI